jgi:uncharacterized protein YndB with AHSA1/START domain
MILRDSVQINAPPEKVWRFIEDPERMKLWNPKIQSITPISWGERSIGTRYQITYVMSQKAREFFAEITEYRKAEKLVIRLIQRDSRPQSYVEEIYELGPHAGNTFLEQRIEIHDSSINIFLRLLISFIRRFGKPEGQKYLDTLKELVERAP